MIDNRQPPHAGRCQILDRRTADPASAHHQDVRVQERLLPRAAHFAQHDVAGVAVQLIVGEAGHAIRRSDPGGAEAAVTALGIVKLVHLHHRTALHRCDHELRNPVAPRDYEVRISMIGQ